MGQACCEAVDPATKEYGVQASQIKVDCRENPLSNFDPKDSVQINDIKLEDVEAKLVEEERKQEEWLKQEEEMVSKETEKKEQFADFHRIIHLFQKCVHFFKIHDLDSACDVSKEIQALKATVKQVRSLEQKGFLEMLRTVEEAWQKENKEHKIEHYNTAFLENLELQMKDLLYYFNAVYKEPFIEKYNEDGVKISTRKQTNTIGAMIECELHVPFQHFAAILTQVDYYVDFLPYCEKSDLLKDLGRNSKVGYAVLNLPFIARRQAYFQGYAYFRFKHCKDIFLYTRSIHDKPELQKLFEVQTPLNKDYVPLDYKYFVINYEPLREGVGNLKFAFNIDNGVHFLPEFVEDYVTREFGKKFFKNILKLCKKFKGSKWEKSMIDNPELSMFIRERIKEQLQHLKKQSKEQK